MRVHLEIAYRGPEFTGWQSQSGGRAVQDVIETALGTICGQPVRIHGAGRTDGGVHALGQSAHFDVPPSARLPAEAWTNPINAYLPPAVRVLRSRQVPDDFHSRFDATGKEYHYVLQPGPVFHPLLRDRAWHCPSPMDLDLLREAWMLFQGRHDFRCFCAGRIAPERSTIRTLSFLDIQSQRSVHRLIVRGNGFLFRMVRCLVGSVVRVARGRSSLDQIRRGLEGIPLPRHAAPAEGLYLVRVFYPPGRLPESAGADLPIYGEW